MNKCCNQCKFENNIQLKCNGSCPCHTPVQKEKCKHYVNDYMCGHCDYCKKILGIPLSPSSESWVEEWALFCEEKAETFSAFSGLQRMTIAGVFQLEGISFIKNTIIPAEVERGREEMLSKIESGLEDYFLSSFPVPDYKVIMGYLRESLTH